MVGFTENDTPYYYIKNVQGDVISIVDDTSTAIITYHYDAWGNIVSTETSSTESARIANLNPIRYRGYYYDTETELYYLNSRYYSAEMGRFLNADGYASTGQGLTGSNMFAYCGNNPIIRADDGGNAWNIVIGAAVGSIVGIAGQFVSDMATSLLNGELTFSNWQTYTGAFVGGAVSGAILGGTGNIGLANAMSGFVTTGVGLTLEKITTKSNKSWAEIGVNAIADGALSYGLGKLPGVKKITKGRNNMSAVYRSGLTKLRNGTAKRMSLKVISKGIFSGFISGFAMDAYYGMKQYAYERIKQWFN